MKTLFAAAVAALLLSACSGKTDTAAEAVPAAETEATATIDLIASWEIENVVLDDTTYARPSEIDPEVTQTFTFTDSTYSVATNCNTLGGNYTVNGDSITLSAPFSTRMACENEDVERLLATILPEVTTVDCVNDSVIRLNTPSSAYILLKK